jgi:hypothetical protein
MEKIYFIPTTKYHFIISSILCYSFPKNQKIIIILKSIDPEKKIFRNLINYSSWDEIIEMDDISISPGNKNIYHKIKNLFFLKTKVKKFINNHSIENIILFSPGNIVVNAISNNKRIKNIYAGEDGIMPYFNQKYYYNSKVKNISLIKIFKQILNKLFFNFINFDVKQRIKEILLLDPKYYLNDSDIDIRAAIYNDEIMNNSFEELSNIFSYNKSTIYENVDVVFFDSDISRLGYISFIDEVKMISSILSLFKNKKILIKPHQHTDQSKLELLKSMEINNNKIIIDNVNTNTPWEIIYFNNSSTLNNSINLCFLTSIIITIDILFNKINKNILLHNIITNDKIKAAQKEDEIHLFIDKIKSIHNKKAINLFEPNSLIELANILHV